MKKLALFMLSAVFAFALVGCTGTTTATDLTTVSAMTSTATTATTTSEPVDVRDILVRGQAKLEEILAENTPGSAAETATGIPVGPFARLVARYATTRIYTPEDYHAVYDVQDSNHDVVDIVQTYEVYIPLVAAFVIALDDDPSIVPGMEFMMESETYGSFLATIDTAENLVFLKLVETIEIEAGVFVYITQRMRIGFLTGNQFIFDYYSSSTDAPDAFYYNGCLEDDHFILINYYADGFDFNHFAADGTMIVVSRGPENELGTTHQAWYDPETMRRTHLWSTAGVVTNEYYELFNEHGLYFSYQTFAYDVPENTVVWWSLIDTAGWDYVVDDPANDMYTQDVELYVDDVRMFTDAEFTVRGYLTWYACLYLVASLPPADFTAEVLNLSAYGLSFDYAEITPAWIEAMRAADQAAAPERGIFDQLDLLGDPTRDDFIAFVPETIMTLFD